MTTTPSAPERGVTPAELRALAHLRKVRWATPAEIAHAIAEDRTTRTNGMTQQGAGRLGGSIATRLVAKGLVEHCTRERGGFPAYRITANGRTEFHRSEMSP